ncbi:RNB domain-containing ribonuclease [Campylobacter troglodytis]|uniref:RNB domain-containing ribonuclease n=1 Tax=Campylobacter troglodytis TaxID=654363 RepID=UPI001157FA57|nr:ribonuclease R family protein [Campylobacter troglodytis]TQR60697.1 ribonuclease R [Campylobacter troglodytis]
MKDFLKSLSFGLSVREVNNEFKQYLRELNECEIIKEHKGKFYLNNGFVFGKIDISSRGTGFLRPFDEGFSRDLLIEARDLRGANYGDIVACKLLSYKRARPCAKVVLVLQRANATCLVITKKYGNAVLGMNIKTGLSTSLKASQKSLKALPLGSLLKINNANNEIIEVLGHIDDESVDEKISLALYNKNDEFSSTCLDESGANGDFVDASMYPTRVDLRHLAFCTIDPIDAKDFDDAIYYDSTENALFVAIADVSEYVFAFSATDKEARNRGFSIYFPHKAVPMLPRSLSENICSLKPNEDRLAFAFKISFDESGEVKKEELFEAIINSKCRFNYGEIDEILQKKPNLRHLNWLYELVNKMQKERKKRLKNAFEFRTNELKMSLDERGHLQGTRYESDTPSHQLIEDCMLLANKVAARLIEGVGIFRNHATADNKKITKLLTELSQLGIDAKFKPNLAQLIKEIQAIAGEMGLREEVDKLIIKAQKKAEYASQNEGHFGLGFERYTHFTSPIRRYSDLILHRLLKARNDEKTYKYLLLNINSICEALSVLEREADKVAWDFMKRKFARWAINQVGKRFKAYIIENTGITIAKLDDEIKGCEVILSENSLNLLEKIELEITNADIVAAKVFGRFCRRLEDET